MANIALNKPSGGQLILSPEDGTSTETVTIPSGGVMGVDSPSVPMFWAKMSGSMSVSSSVWTKLIMDTVVSDTHGWYNTSTYRYTPQIAGWYYFEGSLLVQGTVARSILDVSKSGALGTHRLWDTTMGSGGLDMNSGSVLLYMNGTTDYVELTAYAQSSGLTFNAGDGTHFAGFLVREGA